MSLEMRWIPGDDGGSKVLQFRTRLLVVDASGALCDGGEWGAWIEVELDSRIPSLRN